MILVKDKEGNYVPRFEPGDIVEIHDESGVWLAKISTLPGTYGTNCKVCDICKKECKHINCADYHFKEVIAVKVKKTTQRVNVLKSKIK